MRSKKDLNINIYNSKIVKHRVFNNLRRGQSILEIIVALAVFSLISAALIAMSTGGFVALEQGGEHTEATSLAEEGIEAVRAIRDRAWNENTFATSSISNNGLRWDFDGEATTETIGQYTRTISFVDVCRDSNDDITTCPGNYTDKHTRLVTVNVSWPIRAGVNNSVERKAYITNWDSIDWTQTNWSGGTGQSTWSDIKKYDSDDSNLDIDTNSGQVTLLNGELRDTDFSLDSGIDDNDWPFTTDSNYTYDPAKTEVTGGVAQLVSTTATSTGDTLNTNFDVDASNWTYSDWDQGGGEVNVTGSHNAIGGNLLGWVDVNFPAGKGDELGGYWEQSFTTTVDNPLIVDLDFDWQVSQYDSTPDTFILYVFVDSVSGAPTIGQEVWSSGEQTSTSGWVSVSNLDVSSNVTTSGTYYVKVAVWVETPNNPNTGPFEIGYDNVSLHWEGADDSYPTDEPNIYPTTSFTITGSGSWTSFTETAIKNGGEIYYQLSDDDGTTWQYWNGTIWTPVIISTDYNTAGVVNTNIGNFSAGNESILFKAFLESDGTQLVQLDNINISFTEDGSPWAFDIWDVGGGENTPTGSHQASGGNPSGYNDVTVPSANNDEVGGYWQQSFVNYGTNPTPVTLDFDYKVFDFNGAPDLTELRVYVDTSSGDPTTQVGGVISVSGEGSWISANQYDLSSVVTSSGTYYLKMAFFVETGTPASGPFTVGLDNVVLVLGNGAHPVSGALISSAFDMSDNSPIQVIEWDEVLPSATEAVKFEVSTAPDLLGSPGTWTSWYGATGAGTFFTNASSTLISADLNNNQWVRYRTTLTGDGTDTPTLQEVRVNYK
jgi:hypothetical protein